jgi:hypothetical protein
MRPAFITTRPELHTRWLPQKKRYEAAAGADGRRPDGSCVGRAWPRLGVAGCAACPAIAMPACPSPPVPILRFSFPPPGGGRSGANLPFKVRPGRLQEAAVQRRRHSARARHFGRRCLRTILRLSADPGPLYSGSNHLASSTCSFPAPPPSDQSGLPARCLWPQTESREEQQAAAGDAQTDWLFCLHVVIWPAASRQVQRWVLRTTGGAGARSRMPARQRGKQESISALRGLKLPPGEFNPSRHCGPAGGEAGVASTPRSIVRRYVINSLVLLQDISVYLLPRRGGSGEYGS